MRLYLLRCVTLLLLLLLWRQPARAYSLLTHEQLIDLTWQDSIVPLLLSRYPDLTPAELEQARAYAYGGCVIQDIGYYPFGDLFFSNLTHYVRSGDFVVNLFRNAHNADELAFAVGALSHYIGDSVGHPEATNLAVPTEFPRLRARYGPVVSYAEGKHQHVQTEFAFDIDQVAHQRVAPLAYARHIGLKVPVRQLATAFYETYGLRDFSDHHGRRFKVREYRFAVHTLIPRVAYAIAILHRRDEPADPATPDALAIERQVAATAAQEDWKAYRHRAGVGTYALAGLIWLLPKVGPLSELNVKGPTQATEADYMRSVLLAATALRQSLRRFTPPRATADPPSPPDPLPVGRRQAVQQHPRDPQHPLPNRDLDTGYVVRPGGYSLTDATFAQLLHRLASTPTQPIPPGIRREIEAYYANPDAPITTRKDPARWAQVQADLKTLSTMPLSPEQEPYPTYGDDTGRGDSE